MKTLLITCRLDIKGVEEEASCLLFTASPGGLPDERDSGEKWELLDWGFAFRNGHRLGNSNYSPEKTHKGIYHLLLSPGVTPEQFADWAKQQNVKIEKLVFIGKPKEVEVRNPRKYVEGDFKWEDMVLAPAVNGHRDNLMRDRRTRKARQRHAAV